VECPDCHKDLCEIRQSGVAIDVCIACQGLWFDRGELEVYSERATDAPVEKTSSHALQLQPGKTQPCPRCRRASLEMGSLRQLEAGLCTGCHGVWLSSKSLENRSIVERSGDGLAAAAFEFAIGTALEIVFSLLD